MHWNCRGLLHNIDDIHFLLNELRPIALALQETHLTSKHTRVLSNYHLFRKDRSSSHSSGGVAIVVQGGVACVEVPLDTPLEAVAAQILTDRLITVVSFYLPPHIPIHMHDLQKLLTQLPQPFLILGDFNAHHTMWGSARIDSRGGLIERFLLSSNLCLLNNKSPTFFSAVHNSFTCIDLSISSPSLLPCFSWKVLDNPFGGDHFPVVLESLVDLPRLQKRMPRWKLDKADWKRFSQAATFDASLLAILTPDEATRYVTEQIVNAAEQSIPRTSGNLPKKCKPWWNEDCSTTLTRQNKAWDVFRRYPTVHNKIEFKRRKAQARWTRKQAKKKSWIKYLSSISSFVAAKEVWDRIRKVKGDYRCFTIPLFNLPVGSVKDVANVLAQHFHSVSSSNNYSAEFQRFKSRTEGCTIPMFGANSEPYNGPFTMIELKQALDVKKMSAPGPDSLHYAMLQKLSHDALRNLLLFFNSLWEQASFPRTWKRAHIVPLLKPGKDAALPASYRPIALTSCLGKTYERLINRRLIYLLEKQNLLANNQCGFRQGRSAVDHLVRLETLIREAFVHKQHCISVFFDLERAYDTTWRFGILKDLYSYGIRGRMLRCIRDFLTDRTFQVRLGCTLSDPFVQENGVPQGGILSVILFAVKINSIAKILPPSISYSLYVDDLQISCSSSNTSSCERQLQLALNKLGTWADENGFKFSPEKTVCVPFSLRRGLTLNPELELKATRLPVRTEHKFLGVIFDKKLNFISHLKSLKEKCLRSMNILKVLAHRSWGSDRKCLLRLYNALVRSRLDYGAIVYGSARPSALKMLDPVHHLGLRLATGAFRTSPVTSLYAESNEFSLDKRRQYLSMTYAYKVLADPHHPTYSAIKHSRFSRLFQNKPNIVQPLSLRLAEYRTSLQIPLNGVTLLQPAHRTAPWERLPVACDWSLAKFNKHTVAPAVILQEFQELQAKYTDYLQFYTDGAKALSFVGCAMHSENISRVKRINSIASIFTAELHAVLLAIDHIRHKRIERSIIFVDSQSVIIAIISLKDTRNTLVQLVRAKINTTLQNGYHITFCWVPSHVGILGNEKADRLASSSRNLRELAASIPYQDIKPVVRVLIFDRWQKEWDREVDNKLHVTKPILGLWESTSFKNRFHEVLFCRLRIGHLYITHKHLLCGEDPPRCAHCGAVMSIIHILGVCSGLEDKRRHYFPEFFRYHIPFHPSLLLGDNPLISSDRVHSFISSTGLLHQI
uniref:Putative tick transposon n=1 Tax=Ixodes ricinus TaxID=34613 RepID=A0A147BLN2_IXORI